MLIIASQAIHLVNAVKTVWFRSEMILLHYAIPHSSKGAAGDRTYSPYLYWIPSALRASRMTEKRVVTSYYLLTTNHCLLTTTY